MHVWLSLLRKLLKRGNFASLYDLRDQMLAFPRDAQRDIEEKEISALMEPKRLSWM